MSTIKPFDRGFFTIHNAVFDIMMPRLSANGFKVLCVAIRQTMGWNREADVISFAQFREKAGIGSNHTITRAIEENLTLGYLIRIEQPATGNLRGSFAYQLNVDLALEDSGSGAPAENAPGSSAKNAPGSSAKNAPGSSAKNAPGSSAKNAHTTIQTTQQHADAVSNTTTAEQTAAFDALTAFGVEAKTARKLAATVSPDQVFDWLDYTEGAAGLQNPIGFIVSRLRSGEAPPAATPHYDDPARYISGAYADLIQH